MMKKVFGLVSSLLLIGCAVQSSKAISTEIQVSHINTIDAKGMNAVEISAYCAKTQRLFTASTLYTGVLVFDISDVKNIKKVATIDISPYGGNVNSVAVSNGNIAMAIENSNRQENGFIVVYDTKSLKEIEVLEADALPDMLAYSPNGNYIISANEGEPNNDYSIDPHGSVTIVDMENNIVTSVGFDDLSAIKIKKLKEKGLRIFGKNATFSKDAEPEYLTISKDGKTAWVVLQENNAIAEIDIINAELKNILPLGVKDFSLPENALDVSDVDGKIQLNTWENLKGFYLPDAITNTVINGKTYIITANEGDSRDYAGFSEEIRVSDVVLDAQAFPNAKELQQNDQLGRLKITTTAGDIDNDGDYDELYAFGTRSFSIWNTKGDLVYDSGNDIAKQTQINPKAFNQNDTRSDDKGSEPEALATLKLKGKTLLFVGLERTSGVLMYDISNPKKPIFLEWIQHKGDISPEGLFVIPAAVSPTGKNTLVVSNEISGTISLFEIK
ncbi:choice-of-anchor I family protein [Kordia sp.]|uniref:choice-of-anchor I family protein n=1 Tax=Kordia sp. TaxID=1965332 RepID=UPI003B598730